MLFLIRHSAFFSPHQTEHFSPQKLFSKNQKSQILLKTVTIINKLTKIEPIRMRNQSQNNQTDKKIIARRACAFSRAALAD